MMFALQPKILCGLTKICAEFDVNEQKVREWANLGAPIYKEGSGTNLRYKVEVSRLYDWLLQQSKQYSSKKDILTAK